MWHRARWDTIGIDAEGRTMTIGEMEHPPPGLRDYSAEPGPTIAWALDFFHLLRDGGPVRVETSGTTGAPKSVLHGLDAIAANSEAVWHALALRERGERWLCPLPLNHIGGLMVLARCWYMNGTPVLGGLDRLHDVTVASLVPTQLHRLLEAGGPAPQAKILLGGAGASRELLERARDAGWHVRQSYGLTEACSTVSIADADDVETSGRPLWHLRVTLAPDGEILVHDVPYRDQTIESGDLGRLTDDGRLVVTGRKDDMLVTGGENVMPEEVEAALLLHPEVADAAVYGRPDPEWGTAVVARVVPVEGSSIDAQALREHCASVLARFKVPKHFEFADSLPRSASGKLLRRELRSRTG